MLITAINTVEIDAAPGRAGEVCTKLPHIVHALLNGTECVSYVVADSRTTENAWIVSGYWKSEREMQAHFDHPELAGFMDLLSSGMASRINFNSFVVDPCEVKHHVDQ
jgi:quinol monooxygenase YgiN